MSLSLVDDLAASQVRQLQTNCQEFNVPLYDLDNPLRGIVHVIGSELGLTQPGMTIVCGDSHTATHGAFGALAFGIGTSEVTHVLSTQCLLQDRPQTFQVNFEGRLPAGVTAKDMILALIATVGIGGGIGFVIEYTGPAVEALHMEERMTLCNMSIEAGARAGMIAPDDTTFEYLAGREFAPQEEAWDTALTYWRDLPSDPGAEYDKSITLDVSNLEPMVTYGTNPGMGIPISQTIPEPQDEPDSTKRATLEKALIGSSSGCDLHRQLHQLTSFRSAPGSQLTEGAQGSGWGAPVSSSGFRKSSQSSRGGGIGSDLQTGGRRVAPCRMQHVHRHER
jgi:3-isopropylmalate/(R)-2-methylmalate dehydratase large subunit